MHRREKIVKEKYEKKGYEVVKAGAPDFLMVHTKELSNKLKRWAKNPSLINRVLFVEVKSPIDKLNYNQFKWKKALKALELANIPCSYKLEVVQ